jgi:hypothetical protein
MSDLPFRWSDSLLDRRMFIRLTAICCTLTTLQVASMLLATGAHAQTNACDQLKSVLAARIDASGVRGYTLETVPASTPVPPGAKVIGNCESGASKILYRRGGATRPASDAPDAAEPASAPQAIVVPSEQTRRSPGVRGDRSSRPAPASAATASTPPPAAQANESAASAAAPPPGHASEVATARDVDRAAAQPQQTAPAKTAKPKVAPAGQASGFIAEYWRWIGALVFVLLAASVWVWHAHRSAYDDAGLPRGPRL